MIVCKFGGTSLADATRIRRAAAIVLRGRKRGVSWWFRRRESALRRMKKSRICCCAPLRATPPRWKRRLERFAGTAAQLRVDIERDLREAAAEIPARGAEYAASRGEYLCALLLARYLHWEFVDAAEVIRLREGRADLELTYDAPAATAEAPEKRRHPRVLRAATARETCAPSRAAVQTSPARWWRRRWARVSTRTGRTWTACSPPIRGWWKTFAACRRCATGKCAC